MPDISMCANHTCPLRKDCYRYTAIPNPYRQIYEDFKPDLTKMKLDQEPNVICEHFWWNTEHQSKNNQKWQTQKK